jgi:hypothetical protein
VSAAASAAAAETVAVFRETSDAVLDLIGRSQTLQE